MESDEGSNEFSISFKNQVFSQRNTKNPMITKFNKLSHFIYDIFEWKNYLLKIKDKNRIKLSKRESDYLEALISKIET